MKKRFFAVSATVLALILCLTGYTWFTQNSREIDTLAMTVDTPPVLFVRNYEADRSEQTQVLDLTGLVIGQTYRIVFCVVPRIDSVQRFDLQVAFSTNMRQTMNLYKVTSIESVTPQNGTDYVARTKTTDGNNLYYVYDADSVLTYNTDNSTEINKAEISSDGTDVINWGTYQLYRNQYFEIDNKDNGADVSEGMNLLPGNQEQQIKLACYVLEITWGQDVNTAEIERKETDIVCVSAKGYTGSI